MIDAVTLPPRIDMVTLPPTQTWAIKAYWSLWGPPGTFRVKQAEKVYLRVRESYKKPVGFRKRSSLNASLQDYCPESSQYIGDGLILWHLEKIPGVKESIWSMHPPVRAWLKANPQALRADDIAIPRSVLTATADATV